MKVGDIVSFSRTRRRVLPLLAVTAAVTALSGLSDAGAQTLQQAPTVAPAQAVTQAGPSCQNYTPSQLAVDRTMYIASDLITITGVAAPNDSVSATLSGGTLGTLTLGTATANGTGQFSITGTLPGTITPGSYTVTVTSTGCPTPGTITIAVVEVKSSSCNASRATRTFYPGQRVNFGLFTPIYSTAHPVKITLLRPSYASVLYNGVWPANDTVPFTIPATAAIGSDYTLEQQATRKNGKGTDTKSCPVWIEPVPASVLALTQTQGGQVLSADWEAPSVKSAVSERSGPLAFTGGNETPLVVTAGILILAGVTLVQLRRRRTA